MRTAYLVAFTAALYATLTIVSLAVTSGPVATNCYVGPTIERPC